MSGFAVKKEFRTVVLLDMIQSGAKPEDMKGSVFLKQELGVVDLPSSCRGLEKRGLCVREESGAYGLTTAGEAYLTAREDQVRFYYFASPYIGIVEYRKAKLSAGEGATFEEVMLRLSEAKMEKLLSQRTYVDAQCVLFDMGCLHEMAGRPDKAFERYAAALFLAARGAEYAVAIGDVAAGTMERAAAAKLYTGVSFPPKTLEGLRRLAAEYQPERVEEALHLSSAVPGYLCGEERLRQLLADVMDGSFEYMAWQTFLLRNFKRAIAPAKRST